MVSQYHWVQQETSNKEETLRLLSSQNVNVPLQQNQKLKNRLRDQGNLFLNREIILTC